MDRLRSSSPGPLQRRAYTHGCVEKTIPGWSLQSMQTSSGTLSGSIRELHVGGMQVLSERYRGVMTNHCGSAVPGSIGFVLPLRMDGAGMFNAQPWNHNTICVWNTNIDFNVITPPSDIVCVTVDRALLVEYIARSDHIDLEPELLRANLVLGTPQVGVLARRLKALVDVAFEEGWDIPAAQQVIHQEVLATLTPVLVEQLSGAANPNRPCSHLLNVRRAREVALAHPDTPLRVQDLCRELRIPRRTLQDSFQIVLGISPLSYVHMLRLDGARRSLLAGTPVKEVADTWGFWHWSRFSGAYRRLFGELPSATLKRTGSSGLRPNANSRPAPHSHESRRAGGDGRRSL